MQESQLVPLDETRQGARSLAHQSEETGIASVERQLEARLTRLHDGEGESADADGRLFFWIDDKLYSAALSAMREALPALPRAIPLPFSPAWLVGLFPLRTDLVTLIDPRPFLGTDPDTAMANFQVASVGGEQALLIGETGRLIAFAVDRIGDIVSASETASPPLDEELARFGAPARFGEEEISLSVGVSHKARVEAIELNLATLYEDVIGKLEAWARDA